MFSFKSLLRAAVPPLAPSLSQPSLRQPEFWKLSIAAPG